MPFFIYHPGTGTYMALNECVVEFVDPEIEDVEQYLDDKYALVY